MENVFRVGDKVYHHRIGECEIKRLDDQLALVEGVDTTHKSYVYKNTLSFEPYGFDSNFTQVRPVEILEGEYYYVQEGSFWMIGKCLETVKSKYGRGDSKAIFINSKGELTDNRWCFLSTGRTFRPATSEEKDWLDHCIEKDMYVSREDFIMNWITSEFTPVERTFPRDMIVTGSTVSGIIKEIHAYVPSLKRPYIDKHNTAWISAVEIEPEPVQEEIRITSSIENDTEW